MSSVSWHSQEKSASLQLPKWLTSSWPFTCITLTHKLLKNLYIMNEPHILQAKSFSIGLYGGGGCANGCDTHFRERVITEGTWLTIGILTAPSLRMGGMGLATWAVCWLSPDTSARPFTLRVSAVFSRPDSMSWKWWMVVRTFEHLLRILIRTNDHSVFIHFIQDLLPTLNEFSYTWKFLMVNWRATEFLYNLRFIYGINIHHL